jgi:hypothetical protein
MYDAFENKGKIFTNIITKEPVDVILHTCQYKITGQIHVRPEDRLKDEIDQTEIFLPMTNATVYSLDGIKLYQTEFIAINRSQIVWIIPVYQLINSESPEGDDGTT